MKRYKLRIDKSKLPKAKTILMVALLFILVIGYNIFDSEFTNYNDKGFKNLSEHMHKIYVPNVYDCDNMAKDFEEFFETKLHIDTKVVYGYDEDYQIGHCWLLLNLNGEELEFECTSFSFRITKPNYTHWYVTEGWIKDNYSYPKGFMDILDYKE